MTVRIPGLFPPIPNGRPIVDNHPILPTANCCPADFMLERALLEVLVRGRRSFDLDEIVYEGEAWRRGGLASLGLPVNEYPLAATCFGRYFSLVQYLDPLLPAGPRSIAEIGAGMAAYVTALGGEPWRVDLVSYLREERGIRTPMASPEPFELAALAGQGGTVRLWEIDRRVLKVHRCNRREGIFVSYLEPLTLLSNNLIREGRIVGGELISRWFRYLKEVESKIHDHVETFTVPADQGSMPVGDLITLNPSVRGRIRPILADVTTVPLQGAYDLFWAPFVYPYNSPLLWLASLVKAVAALKVGGLLVTDNFDEDPGYTPPETFLGFCHHAGLEGILLKPPFQDNTASLTIARKVEETPWIRRKMEMLVQMGIA